MATLQDVLFRQYCKDYSTIQQKEMRKYKKRIKKESQPETLEFPAYVLEKFRNERLLPLKDYSNKSVFHRDNIQSQIFVKRNKINKYKQSLSPLRSNNSLREYSNLLFVNKNHQQHRLTRNQNFQTLYQANREQKHSSLSFSSFYNHPNQTKIQKNFQQNRNQLQFKYLNIIKSNNRRNNHIETLQMQQLTAYNLGAHRSIKEKSLQSIENNYQQKNQISGWQDGDLYR